MKVVWLKPCSVVPKFGLLRTGVSIPLGPSPKKVWTFEWLSQDSRVFGWFSVEKKIKVISCNSEDC